MPPIREHTILYTFLGDEDDARERDANDLDPDLDLDDADMPPLVDAPGAAPAPATQESMMSSFPFDFSGVAFGGTPFAPTPVFPADTDTGGSGRGARGRRAPSYIPRPPNAFILFRSSFIRSENVPGRVEGNHSTLSKIIGESSARSPYDPFPCVVCRVVPPFCFSVLSAAHFAYHSSSLLPFDASAPRTFFPHAISTFSSASRPCDSARSAPDESS
ncbi:hypothetical protein B0H15DRAFT_440353 [Mycena belliarum]|uniref:Uncharacterized protein n=1 Tax=Mycena belliarum TaxID=1033014 RepID=A0AAD6TWU5_9AGAR|nr:hypothetical protein B0H15DRAFT_440353 [Mycena belliae]